MIFSRFYKNQQNSRLNCFISPAFFLLRWCLLMLDDMGNPRCVSSLRSLLYLKFIIFAV